MTDCNIALTLEDLAARWPRDDLAVLERSPEAHARLIDLMEDPDPDRLAQAGCLLGQALNAPADPAGRLAAARIAWDRLKERAGEAYVRQAEELLQNLAEDPWAIVYLKGLIRILAKQQRDDWLLNSTYLNSD